MSQARPDHDLKSQEQSLVEACLRYVGELGFNAHALSRAGHELGLNQGEIDLICPNGICDIAALLWRKHDLCLNGLELDGLKIREKISTLLITRLDQAFDNEASTQAIAHRFFAFLMMPQNLALYQRLLWASSDTIWRLAGDQSLDENHYSKRMIVTGILSTAALTRLSQGKSAQDEQIARNIESVMSFEKFKAKFPFNPSKILLGVAETLGRFRYRQA